MSKRVGRPPRAGVAATRAIRIPLTEAEYEAVDAYAKRHRCASLADAVRLALLDAASDAGDDLGMISEHEMQARPEDGRQSRAR